MDALLQELLDKGVTIHAPASQWITVEAAQIAPGTVIYPGARISGTTTSIGPGCVLGQEGPVTIEECQLGHDVVLKGGYFAGATFLDGASFGSSAHVRPGCLLEEQANAAHCVGIKQTILLPFVTLGSLINFCDCLMAGGTSRKDHSEVGSSYIHFNFTPHQDKATPSLFGAVDKGVFLNQKPIFLGGQGGSVGPLQVEYGNIVGAGAVLRSDIRDADRLVIPKTPEETSLYYPIGAYSSIRRTLKHNLHYIGNIAALHAWYTQVRSLCSWDSWQQACLNGAQQRLSEVFDERVSRLEKLAQAMPNSIQRNRDLGKKADTPTIVEQQNFHDRWPELKSFFASYAAPAAPEQLCAALSGKKYLSAVQDLDEGLFSAGSSWLADIIDDFSNRADEV